MKIATIDIGSYSVRLTIAQVEKGEIKILLEKGEITSLGAGVKETGVLRKDRVEETIRVLKEYKRDIEKFEVSKTIAVATEAMRRAKNSEEFLKRVREETDIEVKIITPQEEGELAFLATAYSLKPKGRFVVIDQGGGSTELIYGNSMSLERVLSIPIGIVSLTERFLKHDPPLDEEVEKLMGFLDEEIKPAVERVDTLVGLGGTITTVAALEYGVYPYEPSKIHGRLLSRKAIEIWFKELLKLPVRERSRAYKQVEDKRAEVIVSGIAMFIKILELFGKGELIVGDWGVKHGLIVKEILKNA